MEGWGDEGRGGGGEHVYQAPGGSLVKFAAGPLDFGLSPHLSR